MTYRIKELFLTIQGEGVHSGRAAVFVRFSGCNLWSGRETERSSAACRFCDTGFVGTDGPGGGIFDAAALTESVMASWAWRRKRPWVVLTGGEPLVQVDVPLIEALHAEGCEVAVETNGTIVAPAGLDWICVSPKAATRVVQTRGDELKVVVPQDGLDWDELEQWDFRHFLVQPMDGFNPKGSLEFALNHAQNRPPWRLSLQSHKVVGIP